MKNMIIRVLAVTLCAAAVCALPAFAAEPEEAAEAPAYLAPVRVWGGRDPAGERFCPAGKFQ